MDGPAPSARNAGRKTTFAARRMAGTLDVRALARHALWAPPSGGHPWTEGGLIAVPEVARLQLCAALLHPRPVKGLFVVPESVAVRLGR